MAWVKVRPSKNEKILGAAIDMLDQIDRLRKTYDRLDKLIHGRIVKKKK